MRVARIPTGLFRPGRGSARGKIGAFLGENISRGQPPMHSFYGEIMLSERRPVNPQVVGSSPTRGARLMQLGVIVVTPPGLFVYPVLGSIRQKQSAIAHVITPHPSWVDAANERACATSAPIRLVDRSGCRPPQPDPLTRRRRQSATVRRRCQIQRLVRRH